MIDECKPILQVSIVAEMLGVCERTLRIWEEHGLITPSRSPKNGRRMYSTLDVGRLKFIKFLLSEQGLNISGAKKIIKVWEACKAKGCEKIDDCLDLEGMEEK